MVEPLWEYDLKARVQNVGPEYWSSSRTWRSSSQMNCWIVCVNGYHVSAFNIRILLQMTPSPVSTFKHYVWMWLSAGEVTDWLYVCLKESCKGAPMTSKSQCARILQASEEVSSIKCHFTPLITTSWWHWEEHHSWTDFTDWTLLPQPTRGMPIPLLEYCVVWFSLIHFLPQ